MDTRRQAQDLESLTLLYHGSKNIAPPLHHVHDACSLMTEAEIDTLRELHCVLIENFDPLYVLGYMYEENIIDATVYEEIQNNYVPTNRTERLCLRLHMLCSFSEFLNVLKFQDSFTFLVPILEEKLEHIKERRKAERIPWYLKMDRQIPRIGVFCKRREAIIKLRHKLKQLTLDGKLDQFNETRRMLMQLYDKNEQLRSKPSCELPDDQMTKGNVITDNRMTKYADLLFIALDAEIEHRRIRFDTAWESDSHFQKMKEVIRNTSNPKLMTTLYLARKGSTHVMCGGCLTEGLSLVQQAKENGERLMPCRETGIVLLIEFNLLCLRYERFPSPSLKENLVRIIRESIDHFGDEQEDVRNDFRLIILLKASFMYLGIGLFCDILNIPVTNDERKHGESCLNEVEKNWNKVQIRWKMIWYFAKARVKQLDGFYDFATDLAAKALRIAKEKEFSKEKQNIITLEEHCNEKYQEQSVKQDKNAQNIIQSCLGAYLDE